MRTQRQFSHTIRSGRRVRQRALVVHVLARPDDGSHPTIVGFTVGKMVGSSVVRHLVTRRLRHLMRVWLAVVPAGSWVVVRALPAAARTTSAELDAQLRAAFGTLNLEVPR